MGIENTNEAFGRKRISKGHFLLPLLKEAIRKMNPGNGLTVTDLYKYSKSKVDYDNRKLKAGILAALKYGTNSGHIVKQDRYRYGLRGRRTDDEIAMLCGTCGGKMKKKRRMCSKPRKRSCKRRRRRKSSCNKCPMKRRRRSCKRKRKRSCKPKRRRSCRKRRRSCKPKRRRSCRKRRRSCRPKRKRSCKPRRKSCIKRCSPGLSGQEIPSDKMIKKLPTPVNTTKL